MAHPNLVAYVDSGVAAETPFLVMEYISASTLREQVNKGAKMTHQETASLLLSMCRGLVALHNAGYVHGDVTPANIFVGSDDEPAKLGDFGVAADLSQPQSQVKGTYAYMSPEQVRGEPLTAASDLFALGTIGWELLTGDRLFKRNEPFLTLRAVVEDTTPKLPDSPLADALMTCLQKDPSARLPASDLLSALAI